MRNDHASPGDDHRPAAAPPLPRWARAADVLTLLLGAACLQAALFGGFEIPGLSMRNPWRPLAMALAIAGLRHGLIYRARLLRLLQSAPRWLEHGEGGGGRRARRGDAVFFRALDRLVVGVAAVSYASVALLALNAYDPTASVVTGAIAAALVLFFTPARFGAEQAAPGPGRPLFPVILLVLLAALLFRTPPFRTMHGGQDQGLYVAMSGYLQREGTVFVDDPLPGALPDRQSREIYAGGLLAEPPFGAVMQPGVYYSHTHGDYVFQFYHLHSLWMAAFADLFGDDARFHALTFFGLLSILGLTLLTFELSGSRTAALAAGLLLAFNPLHAFFSRFPVTEAVALAFSSLGFYYLARGLRSTAPPAAAAPLLALAAACVSLVFFVRITGFLYLPALAIFGVGAWAARAGGRPEGRRLGGFCAAAAALYGLSVLYGLGYSPVYAVSVYERTFGGLLGERWPLVLLGAALLGGAALAALARRPWRDAVRRRLAEAAGARPRTGPTAGRVPPWPSLLAWAATGLVAAAVFGSLWQAWLIGFTDRYAGDAFYTQFGIVGAGAGIFLQSGAAAWLLYASPPLVAALVWGMHRGGRPPAAVLLYVFLAVCLAAHLVLNVPVIYRHYYYARYLLSEIVPYSIVLAVALTARAGPGAFRRFGVIAILAAMPFHLFFTAKQMPVRHGLRPYAVLKRIAERVDDGVLLLDIDGFGGARLHTRLQTPLNLYFGTQVFPYRSADLDALVQSFEGALGSTLWLLTDTPKNHPGLQLDETFSYRDQRMDGARTIPVTVNERYWSQVLLLYRQREICAAPGCELRLRDGALYSLGHGYVYHRRMLGPGWHGAEERHAWSGSRAELRLSRGWFPSGVWPAEMLLEMRPFAASPDHRVTLTVRSGTAEPRIEFDDSRTAVHAIPLACPDDRDVCDVQLEIEGARSPLAVRGIEDPRQLGIALNRIGFRFRAAP